MAESVYQLRVHEYVDQEGAVRALVVELRLPTGEAETATLRVPGTAVAPLCQMLEDVLRRYPDPNVTGTGLKETSVTRSTDGLLTAPSSEGIH